MNMKDYYAMYLTLHQNKIYAVAQGCQGQLHEAAGAVVPGDQAQLRFRLRRQRGGERGLHARDAGPAAGA